MAFPIDHVRTAFPSLALADAGRRRIYLDNPAGTQVPRDVADAVHGCLIESNANLSIPLYVKRANGSRSEDLGSVVDAWRQSAADVRVAVTELLGLLETEALS